MAHSARVPDYLGRGLAADRPETLDLAPGCIGFYWAEDDEALSLWSDDAWHEVGGGGGAPAGPAEVAAISTATHNLVAADMGKYNRTTYAGAAAVTVQPNADEAIDVSAEAHFRAVGGALTLTEGSGVTLNAPVGGTLVVPQGGTVTLKKVATNEWDVIGVTEAE